MSYPVIMNGDHAEFEAEWAASGRPDHERPDWPLPSFGAVDWATAFLKAYENYKGDDFLSEDVMVGWFANALMRGYDQRSGELNKLMVWERADEAIIDPDAYYVVQHNGHEWRDFDLAILSGGLVTRRLQPDYVRGRPEWIARVVRPTSA